jgi:single stranded DNA-binding protein
MSNINTVAISGFLAGEPEIRWTSEDGESSIVRLGVVNRRTRKDANGDYVESSSIYDVEVFGKFANLVARKLKKLDNVSVVGRLEKDEWEKDGVKQSKVKVVAIDIDSEGFFRSKDEDNDTTANAAPAPAAPATEEAPKDPQASDIPF